MAHWQVADLQQEISTMESLLEARPALALKQDCWLAQLKQKMQALPTETNAQAFVPLYKTLENSKLPAGFVSSLQECLDKHLLQNKEVLAGNCKISLKPQECLHLPKYFTAGEIKMLETSDLWKGPHIVATRLRLLGFVSLKESTKKVATAFLLVLEARKAGSVPSADTSYVLAESIAAAFEGSTVKCPEGAKMLAVYPQEPSALDADRLKASYPDGEEPANVCPPELAQVLKKDTVVRSSSKKLVQAAGSLLGL